MIAWQEKYKKHPDHALQAIGVFRILAMDKEGEGTGIEQSNLNVYACPSINNISK
ncbi:hypothetical protein [Paenibacillus tundrae]|uniref:hypothetical protein n=1 Tax=Paenibacillus tundrae TaxID=528187 RepID=UPI0027D8F81C|nr:hypothetical protein [Paenibacillus tundrae]